MVVVVRATYPSMIGLRSMARLYELVRKEVTMMELIVLDEEVSLHTYYDSLDIVSSLLFIRSLPPPFFFPFFP